MGQAIPSHPTDADGEPDHLAPALLRSDGLMTVAPST
jgi:hypothetical protein